MNRYLRAAAAFALLGVVLYPRPAIAGQVVSEYGQWEVSGKTGTVFEPDGHFPTGVLTSDAGVLRTYSGASTYLNDSTPFGQEFGSSKDHNYLYFNAVSAAKPSRTTITFGTPVPADDWGFAVGDIDADKAKIEATGAGGKALTTAELGWKGAFNYCEPAPRPSSCRNGPFTDVPKWDAATATMVGNGPDTDGASGWFMPTVAVKSFAIVYSVQSGSPIAQLWLAAHWREEKPDIVIRKSAYPHDVLPGGVVSYVVTVTNEGSVPEPLASFRDDLSDVLDDAHYLYDAKADGGTVSYSHPVISWEGPVPPHGTRTITYSVQINDRVTGNGEIHNVVIGAGHRTTCQGGSGAGCSVTVHVAVKVPCRAALHPAVTRYDC